MICDMGADIDIWIYNSDSRKMVEVEDNSVDLIVTSPPYNCRINYGVCSDEMSWPDYYEMMTDVVKECYRVLVTGGTLAINVPSVVRWQAEHKYADTWRAYDPEYKTHRGDVGVIGKGRMEPIAFRLWEIMDAIDNHTREPIVWVKGVDGLSITSRYAMGSDSDPYFRPAHELILLGSKGQWFHRGATGRRGADAVPFLDATKDVWHITPKSSDKHPAVFPLSIPQRLIQLFVHAVDGVVLDPFMGIGTTLVAAKKLGFKAIGYELNPTYCEVATYLCQQVVMGLDVGDGIKEQRKVGGIPEWMLL